MIGVIVNPRYGHPPEPTLSVILLTQSEFGAFINAAPIQGNPSG